MAPEPKNNQDWTPSFTIPSTEYSPIFSPILPVAPPNHSQKEGSKGIDGQLGKHLDKNKF
jgi:hypothetical protein